MARDLELDRLKSEEQAAFQRKQDAFQRYADIRDRTNAAYDESQRAWEARSSARDDMNREYEAMQRSREHHDDVWDDYGRIRDQNNYEIERLRAEADSEHQQMIDCFEQASSCYEFGDKSEAPYWSQQGHDHKDRRDQLNEEVSRLCREVKDAKREAQWRAPKTDSSTFHRAKEIYERAKAHHESTQAEFKRLKIERDRAKANFDSAQADHVRAKKAFDDRLTEVRANRQVTKQKAVDKVNMALVHEKGGFFEIGSLFGQNAKVRPRDDGSGKIDVYFGGLMGAGDGMGHGHAVIDRNGNVTYLRDAWQDHDDYLIDERPRKGNPPTHKI